MRHALRRAQGEAFPQLEGVLLGGTLRITIKSTLPAEDQRAQDSRLTFPRMRVSMYM
jgi:hypothetical protein